MNKNIAKFLKGNAKITDYKENKKCIYCGMNVYTTNKGICSRKTCMRQNQNKPKDKHGKFLESIINYKERLVEVTNAKEN